ncbi:DUF309 domain-containing protein [Staphylococcus borealis]|uniref:DUF309 domain-containing protein n=1 Tax=Staphylococcus borealis TaxID=2742203 RepID=UPI002A813218|nr:DUF309 domain-containing protein [Staphylococcus borealis]MDY4023410.1 DUF309 domain-containing protein [Staphylococcus borealis]
MEKALIDFYYYFHKQQHYFLCHDILEDAWKANSQFSKKDGIVSLILFSTAMYHYRRGNTKGARITFEKSLNTFNDAYDKTVLNLSEHAFQTLIVNEIKAIDDLKPFKPAYLPINSTFEKQIIDRYPDYSFTFLSTEDNYIVNYHKLRDRSDVINARQQALMYKKRMRSWMDN